MKCTKTLGKGPVEILAFDNLIKGTRSAKSTSINSQFLKRVPYDKFTNIEHIWKCCFSQIYKETGKRITMEATRKNNGKSWMKHLSVFVKELNSPLRESSEECAIQLHYTPQDEIDKGIFFSINGSSHGINVKFQSIGNFEDNYQARKGKFAILREIMSYYSKSHRRVQLVDLWDKCLIYQCQCELKSADEVYELLLQKVSLLQELYVKSSIIHRKWSNSKKRIRPTSFFQLLEDENEENLVGPI
ncbi:hypothetical protein Glove_275g6 [Diversispora epigaea]|uniref:Uncharacterized protein n=1 Tax=Diversispora epigaea TaxID=1348612 RepID=A0A397IAA5_9GLOM|nr:hypothetical protein Glove_275g6 [Diversispora epigaea]